MTRFVSPIYLMEPESQLIGIPTVCGEPGERADICRVSPEIHRTDLLVPASVRAFWHMSIKLLTYARNRGILPEG